MKKLGLALFLFLGLAPAQAQTPFTLPPPAGTTVVGIQVVASCGAASLTANTVAYLAMDTTGKLCDNGGGGGTSSTNPIYVSPPFTRPIIVTGTFTPSATYAINNDVGGLITIATGLPAGTKVLVTEVYAFWTVASNSVEAALNLILFDQAPSTTFTDGATPTWSSTDPAKMIGGGASAELPNSAGSLLIGERIVLGQYATVDSSGNLYAAAIAFSTFTTTTPTTASWVAKVLY